MWSARILFIQAFKKLVVSFGENEWDGPLICSKGCFKHHKEAVKVGANKAKGRVP